MTILRRGSTKAYADNWARAFGGKGDKASGGPVRGRSAGQRQRKAAGRSKSGKK
jgi:hypothetical protein